ncbi:MAG: hypothetical protein KDC97_13360, partial [Confluentibacter sp.]|nr:hypothetical protein [Confluentibacter sp.]
MVDPLFVSTVPNACDYINILNRNLTVYYCVDDFSLWPGLNQDLVRKMENQLLEKADILVATSQKLYQKLKSIGKPTHLLTHGVDVELFSHTPLVEHQCLNDIPNPRVGYFGLIDERSDQSLIAAIASDMPSFSFVMTGPVATDITRLKMCKNVYFTGPVIYSELPALIKGLDILFIPYLV